MALVCHVLAEVGDAAISWVQAHPSSATAVGAAALLVRLVISVARPTQRIAVQMEAAARTARAHGLVAAIRRPKPTARDELTAAAHEAGHALAHAALATLPVDFVAVLEDNEAENSLGFVTGVVDGNRLMRRSFAEWWMLMLLGGTAAEKALLGSATLGGASDYEKWVITAHDYLSSGVRGLFYAEPRGEEQTMVNRIALDKLQREQEALLAEFFEEHIDVLRELSGALLTQRRLDAAALAPFLERVVFFPADFPLPKEE